MLNRSKQTGVTTKSNVISKAFENNKQCISICCRNVIFNNKWFAEIYCIGKVFNTGICRNYSSESEVNTLFCLRR